MKESEKEKARWKYKYVYSNYDYQMTFSGIEFAVAEKQVSSSVASIHSHE